MGRNPYAESPGPFSGRAQELETLERELLRGRGALAAIMAGRGMGKTRLARELRERLLAVPSCETHYWPRTPGEPGDFLSKLGRDFGREFSGTLFVDDVIEAIEARPAARTISTRERTFRSSMTTYACVSVGMAYPTT